MKTAPSNDQPQAVQVPNVNGLVLMLSVLLVVYIVVGKVWELSDVWAAVRGIALLWLPVGLFLFVSLKDECGDNVENGFLSAVGSLALMTGIAFSANLAAVWWSGARHATWLIPLGLFLAVVWRLVSGAALAAGPTPLASAVPRQPPAASAVPLTKTDAAASNLNEWLARLCHWRPDWAMLALILASLCVTARYQRPFEPTSDAGDVRYVLNGDQTYFTSLAYELTRSCPPADCPYRSGVRERAYHSLPHLTLALFGRASGETDLLRNHLVVGYSVLVVLCCGLVFCLSRELGGTRAAGLMGLWLLFVAAIPNPPVWPNVIHYFYFTVWPHSSSTVEPTLLTSPQMFYGITIAYGVLLGVLRVSRSLRDGRPHLRVAVLTGLLAALLLRFRVQCFVVLFPCVSAAFLVMAIRHRRFRLLGVLIPAALVTILQIVEMKLPAYLLTSQRLRIGNNLVGFHVGFLHDWPEAETIYHLLGNLIDDPDWFDWCWQFVTLPVFVALNMLGIPMLVALAVFAWGAWRNPRDRWMLLGIVMCAMVSIIAAATLAVDYDGYSVGGQILLHFGWFALPCAAVGVWRMLAPVVQRAQFTCAGLTGLFCFVTLAAVAWQMARGPSSCEQQVCSHTAVIKANERIALEFCRRELPPNAVLLTNRLEVNFAKWSGIAGRRTYVDYPNRILDPLLPNEESLESRQHLIDRLYLTHDDQEFQQLLSKTSVTHLVEFQDSPLHAKPASLVRPVWHSPDRSVTVWKVDR